jgi:hypothetical protein
MKRKMAAPNRNIDILSVRAAGILPAEERIPKRDAKEQQARCLLGRTGLEAYVTKMKSPLEASFCHSERSRGISQYYLEKVRDVSTSLDMTNLARARWQRVL